MPIDRRERVRLVDANSRVGAANVASNRDVPPFSRAGMDGYAVIADDTFGASRYEPKTLRVIEKVYTGQVPTLRVEPGAAVEIATGAPMPAGADAVVMVEETEKAGGEVRILTPVSRGTLASGRRPVINQIGVQSGDVRAPAAPSAPKKPLGVGEVESSPSRRWRSCRPAARSSIRRELQRADLRHQQVHAERHRPEHGAIAPPPPGTDRGAGAPSTLHLVRCAGVLGQQLRRRHDHHQHHRPGRHSLRHCAQPGNKRCSAPSRQAVFGIRATDLVPVEHACCWSPRCLRSSPGTQAARLSRCRSCGSSPPPDATSSTRSNRRRPGHSVQASGISPRCPTQTATSRFRHGYRRKDRIVEVKLTTAESATARSLYPAARGGWPTASRKGQPQNQICSFCDRISPRIQRCLPGKGVPASGSE